MKDIFIIGSKGIPANYGGFETFVEKLTELKNSNEIRYHVSCLSDNNNEFYYNKSRCFNINVPNIGPAKAVIYDVMALSDSLKYIKQNNISNAKIYILASRIGPFLSYYKKKAKKLGVEIFLNPDGHEWKRAKWNKFIRFYWKISEKLMVKNSDLVICDSKEIEKYIKNDYKKLNPKTTYISYGANTDKSTLSDKDEKVTTWMKKHNIKKKEYYLIVGRFVPENNYELVIKEFMKSNSNKDLVIISNVEKNYFYDNLLKNTYFDQDKRIKFVGTVYDEQLLKKIREDAYAYIHGHEVGGTNPSLLEALALTDLNILLDVGFNKEVACESGVYFTKNSGSLTSLIDSIDNMNEDMIIKKGIVAKKIINERYSWSFIVDEYEKLFLTV